MWRSYFLKVPNAGGNSQSLDLGPWFKLFPMSLPSNTEAASM